MSASLESLESLLPVIATIFIPIFLMTGIKEMISSVSPEFDRTRTISSLSIIPKSPWIASLGWIKKAGVPVLANVAAILSAMCPDLPKPITIILPLQLMQSSQASVKLFPRFDFNSEMADDSISRTRFAILI